jgi:putative ABC transport system ATP-binding protein
VNGGHRIAAESVTMAYDTPSGPVRVLEGVTLEVAPGESVAIVGQSGSGKSTLLGLVGGLEQPTGGSLRVGERELSRLSESERARMRRHEIGFVFQADNLQPFLTVVENVSLQLALAGADDLGARSLEMLDRLGVSDHAYKLPDQLSGGQRQRVAIARALVHRPRLVLADEPTGALDTENSARVVELLRSAQADLDATLLVVTHDHEVAAQLDRTVEIRDGSISSAGRNGSRAR